VRIETVTPSRPYVVVARNGKTTFKPGEILQVIGIRYSDSIEFLTVMGRGLKFEIPSHVTTTLTELSLV
jgi:hypothetical protein